MRGRTWADGWGLISLASLVVVLPLSLGSCKREEQPPKPSSLASLEAEWPPHSATCQSWDALDPASLEALPAGAHVEAFDQIWRTVGSKHYDPTLACLDWLALRGHYGALVAAAGDDATAAYAAINELLGLLNQSHLHATAPNQAGARVRETGPATAPIVARWLPLAPKSEARVIVVVDEALGGQPSGLPRGAIMTSIGGEALAPIAEEIAAELREQGGRPSQSAFTIGRAVTAMLRCPAGASKTIGFLDPGKGDEPSELEVPCFMPEGERMSLGNLHDLPTTVDWRMIRSGEAEAAIGYLAFNFWMLPMVPRIQAGINELRAGGMTGLIVDLRGNPGGVGTMSIPVARMLIREGANLGRLQMREFNQEFKVLPNPEAFAGPLAILVNEGTASTSEIFAIGLRDTGRAGGQGVAIVGASPSAGMALASMIEVLPDGGLIQYVVGDYHSAKGSAAEGQGVIPEILVYESRADAIAGRDPVLDAAVEQLARSAQD